MKMTDEAIIEQAKDWYNASCQPYEEGDVEGAIREAIRLTRASEREWVSVEDRLPETGVAVFVDGGIAVWNGSEWESHMENPPRVIQWGVTHWMHLPTKPQPPTT